MVLSPDMSPIVPRGLEGRRGSALRNKTWIVARPPLPPSGFYYYSSLAPSLISEAGASEKVSSGSLPPSLFFFSSYVRHDRRRRRRVAAACSLGALMPLYALSERASERASWRPNDEGCE